jgi:imidazoleglycerol phosphate dehydratase HisB
MSEVADGQALIEKIRSDIKRDGQSMVPRKDWLALCSNDLSFLGVIARNENWNYELVGDATMRFTAAALRSAL